MLHYSTNCLLKQRCRGPGLRTALRNASSRSAGLVGMPNVGKSTLFNALVKKQLAEASNYPFCTIKPNSALVELPDERLQTIAALAKSARVVGSQIEVTDIAGLIEGASKGAGLGNAFLADIRAVDAIFHVVRCYEDADILHVLNSVDPLRDVALINNELLLADLQSIDKRLAGKAKAARTPEAAATQRLLLAAQAALQDGKPARALEGDLAPEDVPAWRRLHLLTQKPVLYVCNVSESDAATGNAMTRAVADFVNMSDQASDVCVVAAGLEAETAALAVEAEREEFLRSLGLRVAGVTSLLQHALKLLRLQCFYTQGPTDARCWSIPLHATALDAAAAIHTDFAKGFIKAEIIGYEDFIACGGEAGSRAANKVRAEGKAYTMQDGDICEFKFHA